MAPAEPPADATSSEADAPLPRPARWFDPWIPWLLTAVTFVSRLPFVGKYPTEWDSIQQVMGLDRFDVRIDSPHAPGYWLYVEAGRFVRAVTPLDAAHSMVVLAALASAATVGVTYLVGRDLAGRFVGLLAAGFLVVSPHNWFYGAVVGNYAFDGLACALLILFALRARPGSRYGIAAAVVLALDIGFRQSAIFLLAPLALVPVVRSGLSVRRVAAAGLAFAAVLALWVVPMSLEQPGGMPALRAASREMWKGSVGQTSVFSSGPPERKHQNRVETTGQTLAALVFLFPAALGGMVVAVSGLRRKRRPAVSHRAADEVTALACLALAIVPSLGFMYLFHYGKGGYILSFLPAAVLLLLWPAVHLVRRNRLGLVSAVVIGGLVVAGSGLAAQRFLFGKGILPQRFTDRGLEITQGHFGAPFRWTRFAIDENDAMTDRLRGLERVADPDKDVIVFTWLNGSQWLRHVMWTMPGYWVEMMVGNTNDLTGRHLVWEKHHQETVLPVPIGGRAFLLYDALPSGVDALVRAGTVTPLQLATGATVWVVRPGTVINGVTVTEVPPQAMTQGRIP
jgi:transmembrane protein TMEM260 (protein O-mannosyltransferase)